MCIWSVLCGRYVDISEAQNITIYRDNDSYSQPIHCSSLVGGKMMTEHGFIHTLIRTWFVDAAVDGSSRRIGRVTSAAGESAKPDTDYCSGQG